MMAFHLQTQSLEIKNKKKAYADTKNMALKMFDSASVLITTSTRVR